MTTIVRLSQVIWVLALASVLQACAATEEESNPLAMKVRTALNNNPNVVSSNYRVEAKESKVRLSGVAPNEFELNQTLATARNVPGVSGVIDDIALNYMGQPIR